MGRRGVKSRAPFFDVLKDNPEFRVVMNLWGNAVRRGTGLRFGHRFVKWLRGSEGDERRKLCASVATLIASRSCSQFQTLCRPYLDQEISRALAGRKALRFYYEFRDHVVEHVRAYWANYLEKTKARSIRFSWNCSCGCSFRGKLVRAKGAPPIEPLYNLMESDWKADHSGKGHHKVDGRNAAWVRRKNAK